MRARKCAVAAFLQQHYRHGQKHAKNISSLQKDAEQSQREYERVIAERKALRDSDIYEQEGEGLGDMEVAIFDFFLHGGS